MSLEKADVSKNLPQNVVNKENKNRRNINLEIEEDKIPSNNKNSNLKLAAYEEKSIKMEFESTKVDGLIDKALHLTETKSEHDKEDYIGLQKVFGENDHLEEYLDTNDPDENDEQANATKINKMSPKSLLSTKDQNKIKNSRTRCGSEFGSPSNENKDQWRDYQEISENEPSVLLSSPKSAYHKFEPGVNEVASLKSEEKPIDNPPKDNLPKKVVSDDSNSIKCSSVASNVENWALKENTLNQWITSTNKKSRYNKYKNGNKGKHNNKKKNKHNTRQSKR